MLPTPSTSHIKFDRIYEPSEDSYLLLDTLSSPSEIQYLKQRFGTTGPGDRTNSSPLVLEVGTGSGVVLAFVAANAQAIFGRSDALTLGTDINRFACLATRETVRQACQDVYQANTKLQEPQCGVYLSSINADLSDCLRNGEVDVLIFNPPYVPTTQLPQQQNGVVDPEESKFESDSRLLALSYEGGIDGMEVTNRLLAELPSVLSKQRGIAYLLLCKQNKPEEVMRRVQGWGREWSASIVGRSGKQAGREKLAILRISRVCLS